MPLQSLAVSSFPPITGGRDGVGTSSGLAVGAGLGSSDGANRNRLKRKRSSEIHRSTIVPKRARKRSSTSQRNVLRRNLRTQSRLFAHPGDDPEEDRDDTQQRHDSVRHQFAGAEKRGHKASREQERNDYA